VKPDGTLVTEGDTLLRPKLAQTLRTIAEDPNAYYNPDSQLAKDIVADIADYGISDINMYHMICYENYLQLKVK
jgi:gamma-glutamyltranspeptidase